MASKNVQLIIIASFIADLAVQSGVHAIRCAVCDTSSVWSVNSAQGTSDGSLCLSSGQHPAPLKTCPDTHNYCITVTKYGIDGQMRSLSRSCSPRALPPSCISGIELMAKEAVKVCYSTCSEDGCNWKSSLKQLLNLL